MGKLNFTSINQCRTFSRRVNVRCSTQAPCSLTKTDSAWDTASLALPSPGTGEHLVQTHWQWTKLFSTALILGTGVIWYPLQRALSSSALLEERAKCCLGKNGEEGDHPHLPRGRLVTCCYLSCPHGAHTPTAYQGISSNYSRAIVKGFW